MLSTVLRSEREARVNIEIMRAFVGSAASLAQTRSCRGSSMAPSHSPRRAIGFRDPTRSTFDDQ